MGDQAMEFARNWLGEELTYCILNGWTVEFIPINGGADLRIHVSKMGKHSYQIIPVSITVQFYIKVQEVISNLRQNIMEEFSYVRT